MTLRISSLLSKKNNDLLFFLPALLAAGFFVCAHEMISQSWIDPGDHGLNLYVFEQVLKGQIPYKDFWWPYGPLGPYLYAFFINLFGNNLRTVLVFKSILKILSGIILFFNIRIFFKPLLGFIAALFYWTFFTDFYFCYTHQIIFPLTFLSLTGLFLYIKDIKNPKNKKYKNKFLYKLIIFSSCVFASFVRINIGIALLLAHFLSLCLVDYIAKNENFLHNIKNTFFFFLSSSTLIGIIYGALVLPLNSHQLFQCFPYFDPFYHHSNMLRSIYALILILYIHIVKSPTTIYMTILVSFILGIAIQKLFNKGTLIKNKKIMLCVATSLTILWLALFHERLLGTQAYRILWLNPINITTLFLLIGFLMHSIKAKSINKFISFVLIIVCLSGFKDQQEIIIKKFLPDNYLTHEKMKIFLEKELSIAHLTFNHLIPVVKQNNKKEKIDLLALPLDPLCYYIFSTKSPTWHTFQSAPTRFIPEEINKIIKVLQSKNIEYILIFDHGSGVRFKNYNELFNYLYSPNFSDFINTNYSIFKEIGQWHRPDEIFHPGFSQAIVILKKKP